MGKNSNNLFSSFFRIFLVSFLAVIFHLSTSVGYAMQPVQGVWTLVGLASYSTTSLAVNPTNSNILYVGTSGGGVFKSTDGGITWTAINDGLPDPTVRNFSILVIDPLNPNVLYTASGTDRLYKSIDGGIRWTDTSAGISTPYILDMAIDPITTNTLYVGIYSHCGGTWKSLDAGVTWGAKGPTCDIYRVLIDPINPSNIYVGTTGPATVYKTTDGGDTWSDPSNAVMGGTGAIRGLAMDSSNHSVLYAGTEQSGVWRTTDGGGNWTYLTSWPSGSVARTLTADPVRANTVYAGIYGVYQSTDQGLSWTDISIGLPNTGVSQLVVPANAPNAIYAATNNGVYVYGLQNINTSLDVPLLKQTSNPWQAQEYDSAHLWSPANPTINRWGCAMTSATMVFQYHGIKKLPDGTLLDPGTLNTWLKNQPDGYIREGWVNWLALSRLSKLAKNINGLSFDALEYKRINGTNKIQLTDDINNSIPDILEQPGHFIVGKGIQNNTFSINDPFYNRQTLNDGYSNTFLSLGRYVPSHTDLSYMMAVTDSDINLKLLDEEGNEVGESFVQQPIVDPEDPENQNEPISILYAPQPPTGNYQLIVLDNANKISTISTYLYDMDGIASIVETTNLGDNSYAISFSKDGNNGRTVDKKVTFESVIADIKTLDKNKLINHGHAHALSALVTTSKKQFEKENKKVANLVLNQAINLLNIAKHNKKLIDPNLYQLLSIDFEALKKLINNSTE